MKVYSGEVISKKMQKTVTVLVENVSMHRLYGKRFRKSKKYLVHDEFNTQVGDVVNFVDSKPYSKFKKWRIVNSGKVDDKKQQSEQKSPKVSVSRNKKIKK